MTYTEMPELYSPPDLWLCCHTPFRCRDAAITHLRKVHRQHTRTATAAVDAARRDYQAHSKAVQP